MAPRGERSEERRRRLLACANDQRLKQFHSRACATPNFGPALNSSDSHLSCWPRSAPEAQRRRQVHPQQLLSCCAPQAPRACATGLPSARPYGRRPWARPSVNAGTEGTDGMPPLAVQRRHWHRPWTACGAQALSNGGAPGRTRRTARAPLTPTR
eukprot:scaffold2941_cov102-Isochrysis_galbana.AAC.1